MDINPGFLKDLSNYLTDFISNTGAVSIFLAVLVWWLNERGKRSHEDYIRKEQQYNILLKSLKGFYVNSPDTKLRQDFLDQLNQCWIYCPDNVIKSGNRFLLSVHTDNTTSEEERATALREFVLEIRKDLYGQRHFWQNGPFRKTNLTTDDFKILKINIKEGE